MQLTVPKAPNALLASFMVVMLMAGACNVLLKDFMCAHHAPLPNGDYGDFNKPIFWTFLMKCGMALCLPFCCQRPNAPIGVFMLSCFLGFVVDVLVNMAYCAIAGSAIQMLRGGKVILTALLSYTVVLELYLASHWLP